MSYLLLLTKSLWYLDFVRPNLPQLKHVEMNLEAIVGFTFRTLDLVILCCIDDLCPSISFFLDSLTAKLSVLVEAST